VLLHPQNQDKLVKLELASATTEIHAQLVPKAPQVKLVPMVLQVKPVPKATMVYLVTCHQYH
jgi:hypothetical protein